MLNLGRVVEAEPIGHADKFRQRTGLHFMHNVASVDLYGLLADAKLRGYLFIVPVR